ncbi:hypothetical protein [Mycolicibacterium holsaticum]|jgi:hypothetical protein|uniref:hypothetical protein n=1 Tax=Mycolicibacterium holsaticum TaxID=152142 RepID=UPI001C7CA14B|nr:hypothetical protein [Mycolicibacterium holsaticum]MDA4106554.1 hypothetical protein [Mycolicibacterium holsaticum DSM 44478 = JCM 12374]QZA15576.1 hypothetical protein K3U96_02925 [Mycolicibacterium holsaticum DSM 44478 = JCM 12374]UNC12713.1 hypothetical protein H5U41_23900 [Mycolicibacterium holsaticum DSM 44478 = JCM 12374]
MTEALSRLLSQLRLHEVWMSVLTSGRAYGSDPADDRDRARVEHDLDAVRSRFERQPTWPSSGALGERR